MSDYGFHVGVYDESDRLLKKFAKLTQACAYVQNFSKHEPQMTATKHAMIKVHCHNPPDDSSDPVFKEAIKSWIDKFE